MKEAKFIQLASLFPIFRLLKRTIQGDVLSLLTLLFISFVSFYDAGSYQILSISLKLKTNLGTFILYFYLFNYIMQLLLQLF